MSIRWITKTLGTAPARDVPREVDIYILDIRDLVDKKGNSKETILQKIELGNRMLAEGCRVVVCCDYGISRSNAIAAGIIAMSLNITLENAVKKVIAEIGDVEIKADLLSVIRDALSNRDHHYTSKLNTTLITGGSGFLGSAVVKRLSTSTNIVTPPRGELDLEAGSTKLDVFVNENSVQCIIHLANPRIYTSNAALGQTLTMLRNVIDVCVANDIHLIYPSGWEIYSGYRGTISVDEATPPLPIGPYGETKYLCEMLLKHSRSIRGLRYTLLRSSPVYGIGSERPKFLYTFIEKALTGSTIITHRYQNGDPALDLLHIDDLVEAIVRAVEVKYNGDLNLGTGIITTTPDVARLITEELNSGSSIESVDILSEVASIKMDYKKAKKLLRWKPTVSLQKGIKPLIENYIRVINE